jgi:hypothetical protein
VYPLLLYLSFLIPLLQLPLLGNNKDTELVSPSWAAMEWDYLGRPDSESGKFYVQNVRRKIAYNFVIEEFSV